MEETLPESSLQAAIEIIGYNMPGFRIGKTVIAGYAALTTQCGIYVSPGAISSLAGYIYRPLSERVWGGCFSTGV